MCPIIPPELMQTAVQLAVGFVTIVGLLFGLTLGGRA
jgi:hypothetical protein